MSVANAGSDRNLLFGALALQRGYISESDLISAIHAWSVGTGKTLGELLLERRAMTVDQHRDILALVQRRSGDLAPPDETAETRCGDTAPMVGVRYHPEELHRQGGLGEVYVARDQELQRRVALKRLRDKVADDPVSRARFLLEARITSRLEHPGVVPIYGLGAYPDGRPFYAMRFLQGETLREAVRRFHQAEVPTREPEERALVFRDLLGRFVSVCYTIAYAHSRGVLHRDLKPSNIMLGPYGETVVIDWGMARLLDEHDPHLASREPLGPLTTPGCPMGTAEYMAPEQVLGAMTEIDERTDTYLLGATLFEVLTGQPPFLDLWRGPMAPTPLAVKANLPLELATIVERAMQPARVRRFASAEELARAVQLWLAGSAAPAEPALGSVKPPAPASGQTILPTLAPVCGQLVLDETPSTSVEGLAAVAESHFDLPRASTVQLPAERGAHEILPLGERTGEWASGSRPNAKPHAPLTGFSEVEFLAGGGVASIYTARDNVLNRKVVIKTLAWPHPDAVERLWREAQVTAQLEHKGIVSIYGVGTRDPDGQPFLMLRHLPGPTVEQMIQEFHTSGQAKDYRGARFAKLLTAFGQACRALAYAHSRGVIHRDPKPANIVLDEFGDAVVIDWGLARVRAHPQPDGPRLPLAGPATLADTLPGAVMGTPAYMAPEMARGENERVDERSDVFVLGATLYCMLMGRPPFQGSTASEVLQAAREQATPRVSASVPGELAAICRKAMEREMDRRYAGTEEMAEALRGWWG